MTRSFSDPLTPDTKLTLDASVKTVSELDSSTGTFAQVVKNPPDLSLPWTLPLSIDRGMARLYLLQK